VAVKPEKAVEIEVRQWALQNNIWLEVFDSKATFSEKAKSYRKSQGLRKGTPDLIGADSNGLSLYIELKAPGKQDVCRIEQRQYLDRAIRSNCFAVVVSSACDLSMRYETWLHLRKESLTKAQNYLSELLPKKVLVDKKLLTLF
jgi:VRR-NUC domain